MTFRKVIERIVPIAVAAAVGYWPQWMAALQAHGGWYAVAGLALTVGGNEFYQWYQRQPSGR